MNKFVTSTVCLILILSAQAWAQGQNVLPSPEAKQDKKFSADWRIRLSGSDVRDEQSQSKIVDIRTEIKAKYNLSSSLLLDVQPVLRLQSGQTQSVNGADQPENKITLKQAAAQYTPFSFFRLTAGALDQDYMHTAILLDSIAFPAARLEGVLKSGDFKSLLALETAIPTSTSFSTNTKELEPTPSLNTAALQLNWQAAKNLYWKNSVGYFVYNNLPSAVAQKSRLLGNEVNKISEAQYEFLYKYEGLEASTAIEFPVFSLLDLSFGGQYILNQKAPSEQNMAYRYYVGSEFHFSKGLDLVLEGSYFSIAPEAAVAYFNASGFETNRIGYAAETYLSFKKEGFNLGIKYIDAEVMFSNAIQSREKTLLIKLETFYANI
ncbi:MAG: hypothetical protein OM95_10405 [Bdellovibrio sp. ArHS]|uniref:hypothetical protein n=1 Tax=Bdellovibrio sp. ArHS TaxID=1569284 RepID=UPI0005827581|nr:hypothetical protein [Bdellovibrio sp. ArHS]KHD88172.1 MAG: hypothetical protein OM95_10405 [Bdellovibrio sp. ArHS]